MAEQLLTGSIAAPGFYGLNTQDSSVQLASGFALEANNCVIDQYGRIGARKGWTKVNSTAFNSGSVRTVHEFVKSDGNLTFAAANNKIYGTLPASSTYAEYPVGGTKFYSGTYSQTLLEVTVTTVENHGLTVGETVYFKASTGTGSEGFHVVTFTDSAKVFKFNNTVSQSTSGNCLGINILTSYSITDDNWQVASMPLGTGLTASAHAIWVQAGHIPLVIHKLGTAAHSHVDGYGFQRLGDVATNLPTGYTTTTFKPSCALYAYGRLWVANTDPTDTQTVYFSDLQNPGVWTTGTAGKLDLSAVIQTGEPITAIAQHNGFLIFFTKNHVIVYSGAKDPSTMAVADIITGVGCIARDSVQSVAGTDILFLSATGVQSLQRVIQEKSLPFRDVSKNVRDDLISLVNGEVLANIKAIYYPTDAHYLLSLPSSGFTYCFDTRGVLENGASRTTIWKQINPTAFCVTEARELYMGQVGYIGKYNLYEDNGSSYRLSYFTNYFDFDQATQVKILKKINVVVIGGSNQPIAIKWGYDYSSNYFSRAITLQSVQVYEYGTAEYGIATYTNGIALDTANIQASGSGTVVQLGFESNIDSTPLSIQKIDFFLKQGKTL
jgi:hypothetical protein